MTTFPTVRTLACALAAAMIATAPAGAQVAAAPAPAGPTTDQLNTASSAYVDTRAEVRQAEETAEHFADRQAYIAALVEHDRAVDRADARYTRQQMAYADAMAVWRAHVAACKRGNNRACQAPTPRVADFY